jgi:hypothetical protein
MGVVNAPLCHKCVQVSATEIMIAVGGPLSSSRTLLPCWMVLPTTDDPVAPHYRRHGHCYQAARRKAPAPLPLHHIIVVTDIATALSAARLYLERETDIIIVVTDIATLSPARLCGQWVACPVASTPSSASLGGALRPGTVRHPRVSGRRARCEHPQAAACPLGCSHGSPGASPAWLKESLVPWQRLSTGRSAAGQNRKPGIDTHARTSLRILP